jgi:hypothetical protein
VLLRQQPSLIPKLTAATLDGAELLFKLPNVLIK